MLIKTVVPGYPTQLPGSGSTGPMTSGPGYPDPGGKPNLSDNFTRLDSGKFITLDSGKVNFLASTNTVV